jgi:hypothetical protein
MERAKSAGIKLYNSRRQIIQRYMKKDKFTQPKPGENPEMGTEPDH